MAGIRLDRVLILLALVVPSMILAVLAVWIVGRVRDQPEPPLVDHDRKVLSPAGLTKPPEAGQTSRKQPSSDTSPSLRPAPPPEPTDVRALFDASVAAPSNLSPSPRRASPAPVPVPGSASLADPVEPVPRPIPGPEAAPRPRSAPKKSKPTGRVARDGRAMSDPNVTGSAAKAALPSTPPRPTKATRSEPWVLPRALQPEGP